VEKATYGLQLGAVKFALLTVGVATPYYQWRRAPLQSFGAAMLYDYINDPFVSSVASTVLARYQRLAPTVDVKIGMTEIRGLLIRS
jgi:hypothetical protein